MFLAFVVVVAVVVVVRAEPRSRRHSTSNSVMGRQGGVSVGWLPCLFVRVGFEADHNRDTALRGQDKLPTRKPNPMWGEQRGQ